jgi:hypothetical protein
VEHSVKGDDDILLYLEKTILGDVNAFVKAIWDRYENSKLLGIFKNLQSVFYKENFDESMNTIQIQANIIYYISRIPLTDLGKVRNFFTEISHKASHIYVQNGALFSLIRIGDLFAEEKLYQSLSANVKAASYNRRLHLEYFSDILSEGIPPTFDDGKSDWNKCCQKLLEHICDDSERFIYTKRIDIFTIRNLMSSRQRRGPLDKENLDLIYSSLLRIKESAKQHIELIDKAISEYMLLKELWDTLPD